MPSKLDSYLLRARPLPLVASGTSYTPTPCLRHLRHAADPTFTSRGSATYVKTMRNQINDKYDVA